MRTTSLVLVSALFASGAGLAAATTSTASAAAKSFLPTTPAKAGCSAVLMLFTSEGCSDCPGADKWANALRAEAAASGQPLRLLAFHVDYWDKLSTKHGVWADPHSMPECTALQRRMAKAWLAAKIVDKPMVYSPGIVLDGRLWQPKSDVEVRKRFSDALSAPRTAHVMLAHAPAAAGACATVTYTVSGAPAQSELLIALVERGIVQDVPRGENAGKRLEHDNVVRSFTTMPLAGAATSGSCALSYIGKIDPARSSLIAVVYDATFAVAASQELAMQAGGLSAPVSPSIPPMRTAAGSAPPGSASTGCADGFCVPDDPFGTRISTGTGTGAMPATSPTPSR